MKLGVTMFVTDYSIGPGELARATEERGFESLFVPEHTHVPVSRKTPYPGGTDLPREYSHLFDPLIALAVAAGQTSTIKLGTGVCLVVERDPIVLAKEVASLDHLTGGRVLFGIGGGWNREEMTNHGTDPTTRWDVLRERMEALRTIWSNDEASYHGKFVNFDPVWSWPKPIQRPGPPVLVGGNGPKTFERVLSYGDEWMPIGMPYHELTRRVAELQGLAEKAGRATIPVTVFGTEPDPNNLDLLSRLGIHRALLYLPTGPASQVLPLLDSYATLIVPG